MKVRKALITAAGMGTRLRPATEIIPKVLLPLINTPVLQLVIEEALQAGMEKVAVIVSPDSNLIRDYFSKLKGPWTGVLEFIVQPEPKGLGHAIYCGREWVGNEPFCVLFGDSVFLETNPTQILAQQYERYGESLLAVQPVPPDDIPRRGIMDVTESPDGRKILRGMVEKPRVEDAPSNLGFVARALFNPTLFDELAKVAPDKKGEIQLTDGVRTLCQKEPVEACIISEERLDIGNPHSYSHAVSRYYEHYYRQTRS